MPQLPGPAKAVGGRLAATIAWSKPVSPRMFDVCSLWLQDVTFVAPVALWRHRAAVRDRRSGRRDGFSRLDGRRIVFADRNATDGARPQHRGGGVRDMAIPSQQGDRLDAVAAVPHRVVADRIPGRVHRVERTPLRHGDGRRAARCRRDDDLAARPCGGRGARDAVAGRGRRRRWGRTDLRPHRCRGRRLPRLAPALIALRWASPRQTAALSAPFILANSAVGLAGVLFAGQLPSPHLPLYAAAVLGGAALGMVIGLRWLSEAATRDTLAALLVIAGLQLLWI